MRAVQAWQSEVQQLCDVGLPQHLLGLMSVIKTRLTAAEPAVATNSSSSSSSNTWAWVALSQTLFCVQHKLVSHQLLQGNSPSMGGVSAAKAAAASAGLALAVLGCTDRLLQPGSQQQPRLFLVLGQQQQQQQRAGLLHVDVAVQHLQQMLYMSAAPRGQDLRPSLPSATRTWGLLAVLNLYRDCLKGLPLPAFTDGGTGSSSNSSSSGGSVGDSSTTAQRGMAARPGSNSSSTQPAAATAAEASAMFQGASDEWVWQVASTNLQHLPDVPALAKCIGLSKLQLACVAAHMLRGDETAAVSTGKLLMFWESVIVRASDAARQQQQQPRQPFNIVQGLGQLELSTLFMDWVAACDSSNQQFVLLSYAAALSPGLTMQDFTDRHHQQQQQQQQQQQLQPAGQVPESKADLQRMRLLTKWADSTLPVLLRFMTKVMHRAEAAAAAAAAVTGAAAGPVTGSSSSSSSSSSASGDVGYSALDGLLEALSDSVRLLDALGTATAVQTVRAAAFDGFVCAPVWSSHTLEVVSVLEAQARLLLSLCVTSHSGAAQGYRCELLSCVHTLCFLSISDPQGVLLAVQAPLQGRYVRAFMGLLVSPLKLAACNVGNDAQGAHDGLRFCLAEAIACAHILRDCITRAGSSAEPAASSGSTGMDPAGSGSSSSSSSGSSSSSADRSGLGPAGGYVACLPWLVLLGRCCYYMGSSLSVAVQQSSLVMLLELGVSRELGSLQTLLCRLGQKSELEVLG